MKILTTIPKFILVAFLLMPVFVSAQNQTISVNGSQIQISSMLQTVLNQAETVYIPSGFTMDGVYNDAPDMIPLFSGLIMQRQKNYMDQARNIKHVDNYFDLISQIDRFLSQLAKAHNYINPVGGSKMPPIQLQNSFMETIKGKYNDVYINKFGVDPTKVKIAYLLDRSPNNNNVAANQDEHAKVQVAEPPTEINLFGEVSGAAENNYNYSKDDRDSQNTSDQAIKQAIKPNDIVGTWGKSTSGPGCHEHGMLSKDSNYRQTFRHGSGKILYYSENSSTIFSLYSVKHINPYKVVYSGTRKRKNGQYYGCSNVEKIEFEVYRGDKNNIYICGGACGRLVPSTLIKIGR